MDRTQLLATLLLVAVLAVGASMPALALTGDGQVSAEATNASNGTGVQVAAYLQVSAAHANASVEAGMFRAAVNNSERPGALLRQRARQLEDRVGHLHNESATVRATNGSLPAVVYTARASAVNARIDTVRAAIDQTRQTAGRLGVNVTRLDTLRTRAANLTGPEVAAIARNLTRGGPPADVPGGPPAGVPGQPGANATSGPGSQPATPGAANASTGPPAGATPTAGSGSPAAGNATANSGGPADPGTGGDQPADPGTGGGQPADPGPAEDTSGDAGASASSD